MLTKTIPSYLYTTYNDDADLQAFVDAFNELAQDYVTFFATVGLPIYTGLSGSLLDWAGVGLYGVPRPIVPLDAPSATGPWNTFAWNSLTWNGLEYVESSITGPAPDDVYKRVITWQFYKGDGTTFSIEWLKRRIMRFMSGANGVDPGVQETYPISLDFIGGSSVQITVYRDFDLLLASQLAYLVRTRTLQLPFQFSFEVTI